MGLLRWLVLAASVLAGCGPSAATRARTGGRADHREPWTEVTTEHLIVQAPLRLEYAKRMAIDAETIFAAARDVSFPEATSSGRLLVVIFTSSDDYEAVNGPNTAGIYHPAVPGDINVRPVLVVRAAKGAPVRAILTHELTHHLVRQTYGGVPTWLNEGLAQYTSTLFVVAATDTLTSAHRSPRRSDRRERQQRRSRGADGPRTLRDAAASQ